MANSAYQDLLKDTSESKENGNYFLVTISDLDPNKTYPLQFRWMYKDKRVNDNWSAVKLITTPGESEPNTPAFGENNVDVSSPEKIIITWDGTSDDGGGVNLTNYDRVDVYIDGAPFDGTKAAYSFKAPGTATIAAPAGTYQIVLYAVSKTGKLSPVSSAVTKTVVAAGEVIQTPTLPSGLSAVASPFAVTINWSGSYSSSTFTGFKSIDIYAVGSDLGSTATSGISSSNLVGSLTVNDTTNRINVGLDNLKQALSLASTQAAYTAPIFFYYNARNKNDVKYGSPTYTRINSTTVNPIQANYVDLASGVISIEHLEAGNGTFASWLRAGSAGGSRIELSAVNDFTDSGYTVQKGLVAYSSGNTEIFNLDTAAGTLSINGSGTFTGNLAIGSGNNVFKAEPTKAIWLGNSTWSNSGDAPFSVSVNGTMYANSGTVGGWTLGDTYLQGTNLKLDKTGITVGSTASSYFDISPSALTHRNSNGTASGKFTLTLGASPQLTLDGTLTIGGSAVATSSDLSTGLAGKVSNGGVSADSSFTANNIVYKINGNSNTTTIDGGKITTGTVTAKEVISSWVYAGNISANQINAGSLSANYISGGTISGVTANFTTGTIGEWSITNQSYLTNSLDTWLFPSSGYTANGQSSSTFSIITTKQIYSWGMTVSGDIGLTGTLTAATGLQSDGTTTSTGLITGLAGMNLTGTLSLVTGNAFFKNATDTSYLESNRLRVVGDGATSGTGTIFANYLGTGTGTTIVQNSSGFLKVSSSSRRYKENIEPIEDTYLDAICQLTPVTFTYKEEFSGTSDNPKTIGLIAEDVAEIEKLEGIINKNSNDQIESISYERLAVLLAISIKEIKNKLNSIEQRLDALEA